VCVRVFRGGILWIRNRVLLLLLLLLLEKEEEGGWTRVISLRGSIKFGKEAMLVFLSLYVSTLFFERCNGVVWSCVELGFGYFLCFGCVYFCRFGSLGFFGVAIWFCWSWRLAWLWSMFHCGSECFFIIFVIFYEMFRCILKSGNKC
jgi:hypothetical protein